MKFSVLIRVVTFPLVGARLIPGHSDARLDQVAFQNGLQSIPFREPLSDRWDTDILAISTGNFIFNSVASLMQRWPNTYWRNGAHNLPPSKPLIRDPQPWYSTLKSLSGHSIVPVSIPANTILYHGSESNSTPTVPEWLAFDFEHAFFFCLAECWVHTMITTRDLRLLYFDGSSAAKMPNGTMDAQDIVGWGNVDPHKAYAERERIKVLCEWGRKHGLDGFVRMEMHL